MLVRDVTRVRIRLATAPDIPNLAPPLQGLAVHHELTPWQVTEALKGEQWKVRGESTFGCLVAVQSELQLQLVGLVGYSVVHGIAGQAHTLRVHGPFVFPPHRRQGVGTQLMYALAREASQLGCGPMAWQVPESDPIGMQFSFGLGARASGDLLTHHLSSDGVQWLASVPLEGEGW